MRTKREVKKVKMARRSNEDNYELKELLESAHGKMQEAESCVTYSAYPEVNEDIKRRILEIQDAIFDLEIMVENQEIMMPSM